MSEPQCRWSVQIFKLRGIRTSRSSRSSDISVSCGRGEELQTVANVNFPERSATWELAEMSELLGVKITWIDSDISATCSYASSDISVN